MKRWKLLVTAVLIVLLSMTTYVFLKKEPVENTPSKATLVYDCNYIYEKEVKL